MLLSRFQLQSHLRLGGLFPVHVVLAGQSVWPHLIKSGPPRKISLLMNLKLTNLRDFPGGPAVKTLLSQCRGLRFDPWSGN